MLMTKASPKPALSKAQRILISLVPILAFMTVVSTVFVFVWKGKMGKLSRERKAHTLSLPLLERARDHLHDADIYTRTLTPDEESLEKLRDSLTLCQDLASYAIRIQPLAEEGDQLPAAESAFRLRGRALELMYQFEAARTDYETAVTLHPESPARFRLGILGTRELARARLVELKTSLLDPKTLKDRSSEQLRRYQAYSDEMNLKLGADVFSMNAAIDFGLKNLCTLCNAYAYEEYEKVGRFSRVVERFDATRWLVPYLNGLASYHLATAAEKPETKETHLSEAETSLRMAIRRSPGTADPYAWLGKVLLERDRKAEALRMLSMAHTLNPNFLEVYFLRGTIRYDQALYEGARADFTACAKLRPNLPEVHLKMGTASLEFWERAGRATPEDLNAAESAFTLYLSARPEDAAAYATRARVRIGRKEPAKAMEDLDKALSIKPDLLGAYFLRAGLHESATRWARAEEDYTAVLERAEGKPEGSRARLSRARARAKGARLEEALADYDVLIERDPGAGLYLEKGGLQFMAGRLEDALATTEKALSLGGSNARVISLRAEIFLKQENFDAAIREADRAFRLDPQQADALVVRAEVRLHRGEKAEAAADLKRALEIRPDLAETIAPLLKKAAAP